MLKSNLNAHRLRLKRMMQLSRSLRKNWLKLRHSLNKYANHCKRLADKQIQRTSRVFQRKETQLLKKRSWDYKKSWRKKTQSVMKLFANCKSLKSNSNKLAVLFNRTPRMNIILLIWYSSLMKQKQNLKRYSSICKKRAERRKMQKTEPESMRSWATLYRKLLKSLKVFPNLMKILKTTKKGLKRLKLKSLTLTFSPNKKIAL